MSRALVTIHGPREVAKVQHWAGIAPAGTRVEFKGPVRTTPQNDRMWAHLTDIAGQATLNGNRYKPHQWKAIFMDALGREMDFLPRLDGSGYFPAGHRSSELSKDEMGMLITLIEEWAARNGVELKDEVAA